VIVSLVADVLSALAFVGFADDQTARLVVGGVLALVAVGAGIYYVVRAVALWASLDGSQYSPAYHRRRVLSAVAVLVVAAVLGSVVISVAASEAQDTESGASPATLVHTEPGRLATR
jgi:hypothetical protein